MWCTPVIPAVRRLRQRVTSSKPIWVTPWDLVAKTKESECLQASQQQLWKLKRRWWRGTFRILKEIYANLDSLDSQIISHMWHFQPYEISKSYPSWPSFLKEILQEEVKELFQGNWWKGISGLYLYTPLEAIVQSRTVWPFRGAILRCPLSLYHLLTCEPGLHLTYTCLAVTMSSGSSCSSFPDLLEAFCYSYSWRPSRKFYRSSYQMCSTELTSAPAQKPRQC
jgi:hypothetical protein